MNPPSPELHRTARCLIEEAATDGADAAALTRAALQVFQRLYDRLSTLIGVVGFRTMFARSLKLAQARLPALKRIEVTEGGAITGFADGLETQSPAEALEAPTTLLAHFLDLLAAFVGEDFALQLVLKAARRVEERDLSDESEEEEVSSDEQGRSSDR